MNVARRAIPVALGLYALAGTAQAQDLYDTSTLRTFEFTFSQPNWETLLRNNYASQTNILATLTIDGVVYPNVGVRIRGNTSYTALPAGSQKFSLNVEIDAVNPAQRVMGYQGLNLNNGFRDPTFVREVLYNNYVASIMPNSRANNVIVTINGQNWGVYVNVQQYDKVLLSEWFSNPDGLRIKCPNNPNGPGLRYNGATSTGYSTAYEIKDSGGFADPWQPHIAVCNALTNGMVSNPNQWMTTIDPIFAVDPSIWSVVLENILTDDDSYVNKGADFVTYRNPLDGRTYLHQTDANETFVASTWSVTRFFSNTTSRPFLNRILGVPELRQRYLAHYRTAKADLNWTYFGPLATAQHNLINAAVLADPKKLYSHALFTTNLTSSVTMPYTGLAGGTVPGIQQFVNDRMNFLNGTTQTELNAQGPTIGSITTSDNFPDPSDPVTITAEVAPNGNPVSIVYLYYRPNAPAGTYSRVPMINTGGNTYSVTLPVAGSPGKRVPYYIGATAANSFLSQSYMPRHTEWNPLQIVYSFGYTGGMRITEWMYDGPSGGFVEFTNLSNAPINMTGWSMDDDHVVVGTVPLGSFGVVQPGESVIVCESSAAVFRDAWGLGAGVKIIGGMGVTIGNNLSRNDEVNLFNSSGTLVDRLAYGDQTYPGTIRTNNNSGQTAQLNIGQDDVASWVLSVNGDSFGSWTATTGEAGTPGRFVTQIGPTCDSIDFNSDGLFPDTLDVDDFLSVFGGGPCSNDPNCGGGTDDIDFNNDGLFPDTLDVDALLSVFAGGPCL